jgi:PAS domain S-box-containing protein
MPRMQKKEKMERPKPKKKNLSGKTASRKDLERTIRELQARLVQLELQNEELHLVRLDQEKLAKNYEDLYDFAPVGYLSLRKDGQIVKSNLAFSSLVGMERRSILEKSLYLFVAIEDRDILFLHLRRLFKGKKKERCILRMVRPKGEVLHVQLESSFDLDTNDTASALTSVTDISERIRAQQVLRESEKEFRNLAEHAPDIIARFDREYRYLYVNIQAEKVLGIPRENILGRTSRELGYSDSLVDFWQKNIHRVFSKKEKAVIEYAVPTPSGEKYLESALVPEFDDRGEVASVLGISRDVTHFKKTEAQIKDLNARLTRQARDLEHVNRELESFTYSVSHDLRAPLRSIKGFAEALQEDFSRDFPDEARDYIGRISAATGMMGQLIDSLMALSKVSQKELEPDWVDLSLMARKFSAELLNSHPEREVEFVIEDGIKILGDRQLMGVVIQNLFRNAWKFSQSRRPARIEFGVSNEKEKKVFFVKDNGVGFDMSYSDKLFVPFQRLHSANDFPGAGVGLATVQRIIRKHNGEIWADAKEGKGASFYFTSGFWQKKGSEGRG